MSRKRRRPAPQRGVSVSEVGDEERAVLDQSLLESLGPSDDSNRLLAPPRTKKHRIRSPASSSTPRDRKKEQVERKKELQSITQDLYQELQKSALRPQTFQLLQDRCNKHNKKKNVTWSFNDEDDDDSETKESEKSSGHTAAVQAIQPPYADPECSSVSLGSELESLQEEDCSQKSNPSEDREVVAFDRMAKSDAEHHHRVVHVDRTDKVEAFRSELPIIGYEQEIMELISVHDIVVICGQTGCGKTTQVPQFLYEAGYGNRQFEERQGRIGVTQPRRIATTSTAARVADELQTRLGSVVGYQIRHENRTGASTAIKFMTDGILVRELQSDFLLRSYSALIIDEAHERSLNTDLILGMLSRIIKLRRELPDMFPLKVIIMSATLEAGAFLSNERLFSMSPPLLNIPSRQFSVTVHFTKKTEIEDYEQAVLHKVCRIHRQLPPGTILVFLTGRREIDKFCSELRRRLQPKAHQEMEQVPYCDEEIDMEDCSSDEDVEVLEGNTMECEAFKEERGVCRDVLVLPLYAMLPPHQQVQVFKPVPEGCRLIVVATNVAETSVTIPGVRYVVDAGRAKKKKLHPETGVSHFQVEWISKASAVQRAGRAGRTLPGHCYRLYSSAHFGQRFEEHELPEICCVALEDVVLIMKSMEIHKITNFPFPSPPDEASLQSAEMALVAIGALDGEKRVTALGRQLVNFPIGARHARMILKAKEMEERDGIEGLALLAVSLAAVMSLESPFLVENDGEGKQRCKKAHRLFSSSYSDPLSVLNALCCYKHSPKPQEFCKEHCLHAKVMKEMSALEYQLRQSFLRSLSVECDEALHALLPEPSGAMADHLRRCITAGWCDRLAQRDPGTRSGIKSKHAAYVAQGRRQDDDPVFIHPLSVLLKTAPQFMTYMSAMKTSERTYMHLLTRVEPEWIFEAARPLCTVHAVPEISPCPFYDAKRDAVCCWHKVQYGSHHWQLPLQPIPSDDPITCCSYFAFAILSGAVLSKDLIGDASHLVAPPSYATSVEARFNKKLGRLLLSLEEQKVWSKRSLVRQLLHDCHFLFEELKSWLKMEWQHRFGARWADCIDAMCPNIFLCNE